MQVIEVFLPLDSGKGVPIAAEVIEGVIKGLADRFGGATAFTRAPAQGLWKDEATMQRDRIVIVEVMVETVDRDWWLAYRQRLEREFEQVQVLIRVTPCTVI